MKNPTTNLAIVQPGHRHRQPSGAYRLPPRVLRSLPPRPPGVSCARARGAWGGSHWPLKERKTLWRWKALHEAQEVLDATMYFLPAGALRCNCLFQERNGVICKCKPLSRQSRMLDYMEACRTTAAAYHKLWETTNWGL